MAGNKKLISKKKPFFNISKKLKDFLKTHDRWIDDVISYDDLLRFSDSVNLYDKKNRDTLWIRLIFNESERQEIDNNLKIIYTLLHSDGNPSSIPYLSIDSVDYCTFGNSKPFRIKIRNIVNDNFTYFYVKKTDASRVYGIEFEHMLSPRNLNFLVTPLPPLNLPFPPESLSLPSRKCESDPIVSCRVSGRLATAGFCSAANCAVAWARARCFSHCSRLYLWHTS